MATTTKPRRTLAQTKREFPTDDACKAHLAAMRWPKGEVRCPRCNAKDKVYALKTRPFHWVCKNNDEKMCPGVYRFSVLTGSVFENTNVPLRTWFEVLFLMTQSKKGISALQIHRMIDPVRGKKGSYKTAWYMCHRIRAAMQDGDFLGTLAGQIEVDETFIGGKDKNRHARERTGKKGFPHKIPVVGAIARKGNVVCQMIERTTAANLTGFVRNVISDKVSLIATDENPSYHRLAGYSMGRTMGLPHESVNHSKGEYVRGIVHTANLDSFWSLLKRGIVGTYHKVSADHLPLYLNEFSWRHNHRADPDIFDAALRGC